MSEPDPPLALASTDDFAVRLGRSLVAGAETERAQAALDDTSAFIASKVIFTDPVPAAVKAVACSVALRLFRNPDELKSETIGTYSWQASDGTAAGLFLTDAENAVIQRYENAASGNSGLWTQETRRDPLWMHPGEQTWGVDEYGGDPILLSNFRDFG